MPRCLVCGTDNSSCLCEKCSKKTDLKELCTEIAEFYPGSGNNPLWDEICISLANPYDFRDYADELSERLQFPDKEYILVIANVGKSCNVHKDNREWFKAIYRAIIDEDGLSEKEKERLNGIALGAYYMDYEYDAAETIAQRLKGKTLMWQTAFNLGDFYMITRRYDEADEVFRNTLNCYSNDGFVVDKMNLRLEKNEGYRAKAKAGKKEYFPNPAENKEEITAKYLSFLESIGISTEKNVSKESTKKVSKKPAVISREDYPDPIIKTDADFDSFVAFDLETTGLNSNFDNIIEIGAVKVINGEVIESAEFTFQEMVKPMDRRRVTPKITELTGITNDEVDAARKIQDVLPDFMEFVGDLVLVGYNCNIFDCRFMTRAGRHCNIIIQNPYFDVMLYAGEYSNKLGLNGCRNKLSVLAEKLNIVNPRAHRALADAITTARVLVALKKI